jgi:diaminopimelate epimerase
MHGAGNDFVVLDLTTAPSDAAERNWGALAEQACDRHFGIGADGILLMLPSSQADVRMRIFNLDGSEAQMCGNGIRCIARYYHDRYANDRSDIVVETLAGLNPVRVLPSGDVTVDMGTPILRPADIPVAVPGELAFDLPLDLPDRSFTINCVSMGNPHAVTFVEAGVLGELPLGVIGPKVEHHSLFPERVNFEVCEILGPDAMRIRVWERGAGLTLACGSGACASVVVAQRQGRTRGPVRVDLPGGQLTIEWDGVGSVFMSGPAEYVFSGSYSASIHPHANPLPEGEGAGPGALSKDEGASAQPSLAGAR